MWTEDKSRPPITNLALCVEDNNGGPNEKFPGWEVVRFANSNIPANLNLGVVQTEGANKNKSAPCYATRTLNRTLIIKIFQSKI